MVTSGACLSFSLRNNGLAVLLLGLAQASCLVRRVSAVMQVAASLLSTIVAVLCMFSNQMGASFASLVPLTHGIWRDHISVP